MKWFNKKKVQTESEEPYEYWKDPRLDDEGTYDYFVERLPRDKAEWDFKYVSRCDSCGKEHRINFRASHYFYCWDGWDGMDYTECWECVLKGRIHSIKHKIKRKFKILFQAIDECIDEKSFKHFKIYYKIAKSSLR